MSWFKVDDALWGHPKWVAASPRARALWVTAGSWAACHLTDGFVPAHILSILGARGSDADALVKHGLWVADVNGWRFHDWQQFQLSRDAVMSQRDAARIRQQRARDRARESREKSRERHGVTNGVSSFPPTRPVNTGVLPNGTTPVRGARKRATRIPDTFLLSNDDREWARAKGFAEEEIDRHTERFVYYWQAKGGKDATKIDWPKSWRKWMLGETPAKRSALVTRPDFDEWA